MNKVNKSFFLEIRSEELPTSAQFIDDYKLFFQNSFIEHNIHLVGHLEVYVTPCRVVIYSPSMIETITVHYKDIKGPKESDTDVVKLFCKKHKIKFEDLVYKNGYAYYEKPSIVKNTFDVLSTILPTILKNFRFSEQMVWNDTNASWSRPIQSIVCLFDNKQVKFFFAGIESGNMTIGNKYLNASTFKVVSFEQYKQELDKRYVLLDRTKIITQEVMQIMQKNHFAYDENECSHMIQLFCQHTEYGHVAYNQLSFVDFPVNNMVWHKIFQQVMMDEMLLSFHSYFLFVSNVPVTDDIQNDYLNIVDARLKDALFLFNLDDEIDYQVAFEQLKDISFHNGKSNIYEQMLRFEKIAEFMKIDINLEVVKYYKVGMLSNLYPDYPLLLKYFSFNLLQKNFTQEDCLSEYLELIDNIDMLVYLFIAGERVKGSKDLFGMRKKAFCIIDFCYNKEINIGKIVRFVHDELLHGNVLDEILSFLTTRVKYKIPYVINVVFETMLNIDHFDDLNAFITNYMKLADLYNNNKDFLHSIYRLEKLVSLDNPDQMIDVKLLTDKYEIALYQSLKKDILTINNVIIDMLDNCKIKVQDIKIQSNRQKLINYTYNTIIKDLKITKSII